MTNTKPPLSREERSEIWKSFWLHAAAAAGFIILGVFATTIAEKAGSGGGKLLLMSLIQGISNFLVWARFVKRIEKYKESTGIPYPSTYLALALGSFVIIVGPLVLFFSLLIRLHNVPFKQEAMSQAEKDDSPLVEASKDLENPRVLLKNAKESSKDEVSNPPPVTKPVIPPVLSSDGTPRTEQTISKLPTDQVTVPASPSLSPPKPPIQDSTMDDECFYEEVAKELESNTLKPGLWTRAFAEANGSNDLARAIYIRLRVTQLSDARNAELERQRLAAAEEARLKAEELEKQRLAEAEEARKKAEELEKARTAAAEEKRKREAQLERERLEAEKLERIEAEKRQQEVLLQKEREENLRQQEAMERARKARELEEELRRKLYWKAQKEAAERAAARKKAFENFVAPLRRYLIEIGAIPYELTTLPEPLKCSATAWNVHFGGLLTDESRTGFVKRGRLRIENGTLILDGWKLFNKTLRVLIGIVLASVLMWSLCRLDGSGNIKLPIGADMQKMLSLSFSKDLQSMLDIKLPYPEFWNVKGLVFIIISVCIAGYFASYHLAFPGSATFVPVTRPKLRGRSLTMKIRHPNQNKSRLVRFRFRNQLDARIFKSHFETQT